MTATTGDPSTKNGPKVGLVCRIRRRASTSKPWWDCLLVCVAVAREPAWLPSMATAQRPPCCTCSTDLRDDVTRESNIQVDATQYASKCLKVGGLSTFNVEVTMQGTVQHKRQWSNGGSVWKAGQTCLWRQTAFHLACASLLPGMCCSATSGGWSPTGQRGRRTSWCSTSL